MFYRLFTVATLSLLVSTLALGQKLTKGPYLQLGEEDGMTSLVLSWFTDLPSDSVVELGTNKQFQFRIHNRESVFHHVVTLAGLQPDTDYQYRIFSNGRRLYEGKSAQTLPFSDRPIRFAAFGDSGTGDSAQYQLASQIIAARPEFTIHTGDLIYDKGEEKDYQPNFFAPYRELIDRSIFFPSIGNHDWATDNAAPLLKHFILPPGLSGAPGVRPEEFYSFDHGNAHFVALNTNLAAKTNLMNDHIIPWLRQDLMASTKPWKIVFFHHPPYSDGKHGDDRDVQQRLVPVFEEAGVNVVFTGHDHLYQRFKPILKNTVVNGFNEGAIQYIVTGAGGKKLYPINPSQRSAAAFNKDFSFSLIDITGALFRIRQISRTGAIVDDFSFSLPPKDRYRLWVGSGGSAFYHFDKNTTKLGYGLFRAQAGSSALQLTSWIKSRPESTSQFATSVDALVPSRESFFLVEENPVTGTGIAVVNPNGAQSSVELTMYTTSGQRLRDLRLDLAPEQQKAFYLRDLIPDLPYPYSGLVKVTASEPILAYSVRTIFSKGKLQLVSSPAFVASDRRLAYLPFLPAVDGFSSRVVLLNTYDQSLEGTLTLRRSNDQRRLDLPYSIPRFGTTSFEVAQAGPGLWTASVHPVRNQSPKIMAILETTNQEGLVSQTLLRPRAAKSHFVMPFETQPQQPFSFALMNHSNRSAQVNLQLRSRSGAAFHKSQLSLKAGELRPGYLEDFFGKPLSCFQGTLEVSSSEPILLEAFLSKLTDRNSLAVASFPAFDVEPRDERVFLPLIAIGPDFQTELQLSNSDERRIEMQIELKNSSGAPLEVIQRY